MFVLKSLIDKYINSKGRKLYSCFSDFHKAFETVIHPGLRVKLKELNIYGRFYDVLCSLYDKSNTCVRLGEDRTDFFASKEGVRQGDVLSPNLYKIFINDLPESLHVTEPPGPAYIYNKPLYCLMYADNIVLFSTSSWLQDKLDKLSKYCKDRRLYVSVSKTKVLIFNKSGKQVQNNFFFNDICLENVKHYRYLGVYFSATGIFNCAQDDIFKTSIKATFKL